ncbi:uncharacterized protein ARMOST_18980 [Armillaria ostoyae]|uniref:Uncharacterized protein n=1 Tax=Armillaria ostoyae TaxID=47428 RepID=A0A284S391_ARMOS|nr:uncharacterized protein ARMOST_18980 [Armillaria ostoyae]
MDKGRVIVDITVNVRIRSMGTRERDGQAKDELVEWVELFDLYLGHFFIAVSRGEVRWIVCLRCFAGCVYSSVVGYTQSLEIEVYLNALRLRLRFKENIWESSRLKGSQYSVGIPDPGCGTET